MKRMNFFSERMFKGRKQRDALLLLLKGTTRSVEDYREGKFSNAFRGFLNEYFITCQKIKHFSTAAGINKS